jgi:hypothetical protein
MLGRSVMKKPSVLASLVLAAAPLWGSPAPKTRTFKPQALQGLAVE